MQHQQHHQIHPTCSFLIRCRVSERASTEKVRSFLMSSSFPAMSENGGHDGVEKEGGVGRGAENVDPPATGSRRRGGSGLFALSSDESGTLVVVATLITTLSYQIGSNIPGGYWQDDAPGHHRAGEPIMRTERRWLYRVFMCSSWAGFAASMGLTLALLTGVPPRSRFVRGLFVLSYSTLTLSFITQQAFVWVGPFVWFGLLVWAAVAALITYAITYRTHRRLCRIIDWLCMEPPVAQTS